MMVRLSYQQLGEIARSRQVRKKLDDVADQVAARARAIATAEGLDADIVQKEGTRPKGRPYARVSIPAANEFGDSKTQRRRILGRAVQGR